MNECKNIILWFRKDLRLQDNPAYYHATSEKNNIFPIYIYDIDLQNTSMSPNNLGQWWIVNSLAELNKSLNNKLTIFRDKAAELILQLCKKYDITHVYFNEHFEALLIKQQELVSDLLIQHSIQVNIFSDELINMKQLINSRKNYFKTFSNFYNTVVKNNLLLPALNEDTSINLCTFHKINHNFKNTKYYTPKQSLYYLPGEKNAQHTLEYFRLFNSTKYYLKDYPYIDSTSKLSPYISNGEISIRSIYSAFKDDDLYVSFLRQIIFSEYTRYLLLQFPDLDKISVNSKIENIGWKFNEEYFTAWCEGQTGYLMVDAAMRQLQECGYISNRLRMIAASFCVKQLNIPWQYGADWFRINLIDFDIARNSFNWQWIAGAIGPIYNYVTRCINPNLQLKKLDPNLAYVKLFIKEINNSNFSYITPIVKFEDTVLQIKKRFLLLFPKS